MSSYEAIEILPRNIFVTGREAAMEWTIKAAVPEGTITFDGVDVFTFDEAARIVSVRAYWERGRVDEQRPRLLGLPRGTVQVVAADPRWPELFRAEAARLAAAVASNGLAPLALEHVGSTAVAGLAAKPILDIMAGCPPGADREPYLKVCVALGYEPRGPQGVPGRELLVLGPATARSHHLNLVEVDGRFWRDHLVFRDLLRARPALASAYAALKRGLAARYASDRAAYTAGKAAFVSAVLDEQNKSEAV